LKKAACPKGQYAKPRAYTAKSGRAAGYQWNARQKLAACSYGRRGTEHMRRLFLSLLALIMVGSVFMIAYPVTAEAATKAKENKSVINMDTLIGKNISVITKAYGKQQRIDESEYGFKWYVYNKNYKRFMMVGVYNNTVVAAYCNSPYLLAKGFIKLGVNRTAVRKKLGEPITCVQQGNTIYVLPNTDQKDLYDINGYYVTVYFDKYDKYKTTSVLFIKKEYEDTLMGKTVSLTSAMITAYSKESVDLVNSMRARKGLSILKEDSQANKLALYRSTDMRKRNYFSHYTPEGRSPAYVAKSLGIKIRTLCENIACGHRTAVSAFEAFMNSKGHRANILYKNVKLVGTGTAYGGDYSVLVTYSLMTKK
jgi:uncharacterized protein YkwD